MPTYTEHISDGYSVIRCNACQRIVQPNKIRAHEREHGQPAPETEGVTEREEG